MQKKCNYCLLRHVVPRLAVTAPAIVTCSPIPRLQPAQVNGTRFAQSLEQLLSDTGVQQGLGWAGARLSSWAGVVTVGWWCWVQPCTHGGRGCSLHSAQQLDTENDVWREALGKGTLQGGARPVLWTQTPQITALLPSTSLCSGCNTMDPILPSPLFPPGTLPPLPNKAPTF